MIYRANISPGAFLSCIIYFILRFLYFGCRSLVLLDSAGAVGLQQQLEILDLRGDLAPVVGVGDGDALYVSLDRDNAGLMSRLLWIISSAEAKGSCSERYIWWELDTSV